MILADKIINERKKNGWSQEELAEKLSVSRQSISKWEGAQAIPDIQKIIKMAELFGVSTDYLLKDELEPEEVTPKTVTDTDYDDIRKVSMEEANDYLKIIEKIAPRRANMVSLCIFAPALLIFFLALSQIEGFPLPENLMTGIGVVSLLVLIATAVFFFIIDASKLKPYEYLETTPIETLYGVSGMVNEKRKAHEHTNVVFVAIGVTLCILSCVPLVIVSIAGASNTVILFMVCVLLLFICAGVNLLVRIGSINEAFKKLLQEEDYSPNAKKQSPIVNTVSSIYWISVTAGFLAWSFITNDWGRTWIVWPIAGVLFAVVITIVKSVAGGSEKRN